MTTPARVAGCELCEHDGGRLVHREDNWRVVGVDDAAFPAFYRVVCHRHVAEFSDLDAAARERCMALVVAVERTLREWLQPTKVNVASLGNMTPHLHWHVIARFDWDSHFPQPVWGSAQRSGDAQRLAELRGRLPAVDAAIAAALAVR